MEQLEGFLEEQKGCFKEQGQELKAAEQLLDSQQQRLDQHAQFQNLLSSSIASLSSRHSASSRALSEQLAGLRNGTERLLAGLQDELAACKQQLRTVGASLDLKVNQLWAAQLAQQQVLGHLQAGQLTAAQAGGWLEQLSQHVLQQTGSQLDVRGNQMVGWMQGQLQGVHSEVQAVGRRMEEQHQQLGHGMGNMQKGLTAVMEFMNPTDAAVEMVVDGEDASGTSGAVKSEGGDDGGGLAAPAPSQVQPSASGEGEASPSGSRDGEAAASASEGGDASRSASQAGAGQESEGEGVEGNARLGPLGAQLNEAGPGGDEPEVKQVQPHAPDAADADAAGVERPSSSRSRSLAREAAFAGVGSSDFVGEGTTAAAPNIGPQLPPPLPPQAAGSLPQILFGEGRSGVDGLSSSHAGHEPLFRASSSPAASMLRLEGLLQRRLAPALRLSFSGPRASGDCSTVPPAPPSLSPDGGAGAQEKVAPESSMAADLDVAAAAARQQGRLAAAAARQQDRLAAARQQGRLAAAAKRGVDDAGEEEDKGGSSRGGKNPGAGMGSGSTLPGAAGGGMPAGGLGLRGEGKGLDPQLKLMGWGVEGRGRGLGRGSRGNVLRRLPGRYHCSEDDECDDSEEDPSAVAGSDKQGAGRRARSRTPLAGRGNGRAAAGTGRRGLNMQPAQTCYPAGAGADACLPEELLQAISEEPIENPSGRSERRQPARLPKAQQNAISSSRQGAAPSAAAGTAATEGSRRGLGREGLPEQEDFGAGGLEANPMTDSQRIRRCGRRENTGDEAEALRSTAGAAVQAERGMLRGLSNSSAGRQLHQLTDELGNAALSDISRMSSMVPFADPSALPGPEEQQQQQGVGRRRRHAQRHETSAAAEAGNTRFGEGAAAAAAPVQTRGNREGRWRAGKGIEGTVAGANPQRQAAGGARLPVPRKAAVTASQKVTDLAVSGRRPKHSEATGAPAGLKGTAAAGGAEGLGGPAVLLG